MEAVSISRAIELALEGLGTEEQGLLRAYLHGRDDSAKLKNKVRPEVCQAVVTRISSQKLAGNGVNELLSRAGALVRRS